MIKRLQNRIAESRLTLPLTAFYSVCIWLLAGLVQQHWWIQFACFVISAWMMMQFNNQNLLIRFFSRLVSCHFLALTCAAAFLFPTLSDAIAQTGAIFALFLLWGTYKDQQSPGRIFYAFLFLGIACIAESLMFYFVPLFWIWMAWFVYSFSWRTFMASVAGLLAPYWFCLPWVLFIGNSRILPSRELFDYHHFITLPDYSSFDGQELWFLLWLILLIVGGSIHFIFNSYQDKIRVRQIHYSLMFMAIWSVILIGLQPQCYGLGIRMLIISASVISAHAFALSHSRLSNMLYMAFIAITLFFTGMNLWTSSSLF